MHREHTIYMERYVYASGMRQVNGDLKTGFCLIVLILDLALDSPAVSAFIVGTMFAMAVGLCGVKPKDYIRMMGIPAVFIIFSGIALLFASQDGRRAAEVTLRALGAVSAFYFLILSTTVSELLMTLQKCHMPRLFLELTYLIYRFIFVLTDVWNRSDIAAGARLGYVDYRTSLRTFGAVAGNLFVLSMKRADACYDAMVSRCYTGELRFLEEEKKCRPREWAGILLYVGSLILVRRFLG